MKKAFTLIELIFVIAIIGIMSGMGAEIIMKMYDTYFESRTQNEIQAKTQLALDQISARLTYRIKPSVIVSQNVNTYSSLESYVAIAAGTS